MEKTHKITIISATAERITNTDKIACFIKAAALDIENNFLDMELMQVFVDGEKISEDASNQIGELTMHLQLDYKQEKNAFTIHVQHTATGISSPRKYVPIIGSEKDVSPTQKQLIQEKNVAKNVDISPADRILIIAVMKENGMKLGDNKYEDCRDDYTIVLTAVKQNGAALQFASERLKDDSSIVDESLCQNAEYIQFASEGQQRIYVMQVREVIDKISNEVDSFNKFDKGKSIYQNIGLKFKYNRDIFISALLQYGINLLWNDFFKFNNDKQIGCIAVSQNGLILANLSDILKDDKDVTLIAVGQNGLSLCSTSARLKDDKDVILAAIKKDPHTLGLASSRLQIDPDLLKAAGK